MHSPRMPTHIHYACPNISCDHKYLHVTYCMNVWMIELIMPLVLGKVNVKNLQNYVKFEWSLK
jgi:hypothetical protein